LAGSEGQVAETGSQNLYPRWIIHG
jgi:hypothetical protein